MNNRNCAVVPCVIAARLAVGVGLCATSMGFAAASLPTSAFAASEPKTPCTASQTKPCSDVIPPKLTVTPTKPTAPTQPAPVQPVPQPSTPSTKAGEKAVKPSMPTEPGKPLNIQADEKAVIADKAPKAGKAAKPASKSAPGTSSERSATPTSPEPTQTSNKIIAFKNNTLKQALLASMTDDGILEFGAKEISESDALKMTGFEYNPVYETVLPEGISDLSYFKNLKTLAIFNKKNIGDTSVLGDLTKLTSVELSFPGEVDIAALQNLKSLNKLALQSCTVKNSSLLKDMTQLTSLTLAENEITDISVLKNMTQLTSLTLAGERITDISALAQLTNLTSLSIAHMKNLDLSQLQHLTKLSNLSLSDSPCIDVSPLQKLVSLKQLHLKQQAIKNTESLTNITSLIISRIDNKYDMKPIVALPNLKSLWIRSGTLPHDTSGLPKSKTLTDLRLGDSYPFTSPSVGGPLNSLYAFSNVTSLDISGLAPRYLSEKACHQLLVHMPKLVSLSLRFDRRWNSTVDLVSKVSKALENIKNPPSLYVHFRRGDDTSIPYIKCIEPIMHGSKSTIFIGYQYQYVKGQYGRKPRIVVYVPSIVSPLLDTDYLKGPQESISLDALGASKFYFSIAKGYSIGYIFGNKFILNTRRIHRLSYPYAAIVRLKKTPKPGVNVGDEEIRNNPIYACEDIELYITIPAIHGRRFEADPTLSYKERTTLLNGKDGIQFEFKTYKGYGPIKDNIVKKQLNAAQALIKIGNVKTEKNKEIPFKTRYIDDNTLDEGQEVVETVGKKGSRTVITTYRVDENMGLTDEVLSTQEKDVVPAVDEVIRRGTKQNPNPNPNPNPTPGPVPPSPDHHGGEGDGDHSGSSDDGGSGTGTTPGSGDGTGTGTGTTPGTTPGSGDGTGTTPGTSDGTGTTNTPNTPNTPNVDSSSHNGDENTGGAGSSSDDADSDDADSDDNTSPNGDSDVNPHAHGGHARHMRRRHAMYTSDYGTHAHGAEGNSQYGEGAQSSAGTLSDETNKHANDSDAQNSTDSSSSNGSAHASSPDSAKAASQKQKNTSDQEDNNTFSALNVGFAALIIVIICMYAGWRYKRRHDENKKAPQMKTK